jgi:signal transduction histidine kinase
MNMRLQLLLSFALVIVLMMGSSWWLAGRSTDAQFAILVTGVNQRQARLMAPALLEEYALSGSWSEVQKNLVAQIEQQDLFARSLYDLLPNSDGLSGGVLSLSMQEANSPTPLASSNISENPYPMEWMMLPEEVIAMLEKRPYREHMGDRFNRDSYLVIPQNIDDWQLGNLASGMMAIESPGLTWLVGTILMGDQRILVIDPSQRVVVDSESSLLGKTVQSDTTHRGISLYHNTAMVGTLVITSRDGVYTLEQNSFLAEVKQGFLMSALLSGGIALVLALGLAHQITRPIRSLTNAVSRLQAGEWGYQVNFRANNEIAQLAGAFNQMSSHLAEQRRLRTRLVDDLAHELNTPLSLMHLELQGMADGLQTPTEAAEHLTQELSEVTDLVADLIFLASADTAPRLQMDWVDINALVTAAARRFEGAAIQQKNLTMQIELHNDLPMIYGDGYPIQRAISNLLSNAIRHTPTGGIITIKSLIENRYIGISVQDTGEGIAPEHLPHIFERFYRADESRTRHSGGRGLGLAIVKQIVEQHGGNIRVESTLGKGSNFTLLFPITPLQASP